MYRIISVLSIKISEETDISNLFFPGFRYMPISFVSLLRFFWPLRHHFNPSASALQGEFSGLKYIGLLGV
jgi:hypothetical protein